jgi:hypothetical protein
MEKYASLLRPRAPCLWNFLPRHQLKIGEVDYIIAGGEYSVSCRPPQRSGFVKWLKLQYKKYDVPSFKTSFLTEEVKQKWDFKKSKHLWNIAFING